MKKDAHPQYQQVIFTDSSSGKKFVCGTAAHSKQKEADGTMVIPVSISSASHPYFVGGKQFVDAEGRVDRFNKRYQPRVAKPQVEEPVVETASAVSKKTSRKKTSV